MKLGFTSFKAHLLLFAMLTIPMFANAATLGVRMAPSDLAGAKPAIKVFKVLQASSAQKGGLQAGDLILGFALSEGREQVSNKIESSRSSAALFEKFSAALRAIEKPHVLTLKVQRWCVSGTVQDRLQTRKFSASDIPSLSDYLSEHQEVDIAVKLKCELQLLELRIKLPAKSRSSKAADMQASSFENFPFVAKPGSVLAQKSCDPDIALLSRLAQYLRKRGDKAIDQDLKSRFLKAIQGKDSYRLGIFDALYCSPEFSQQWLADLLARSENSGFGAVASKQKLRPLGICTKILSVRPQSQPTESFRLSTLPKFRRCTGNKVSDHLVFMKACLSRSQQHLDRAIGKLSSEQQRFVSKNASSLLRSFARWIDLSDDPDIARRKRNLSIVEMLRSVDRAELLQAAQAIELITNAKYLKVLKQDLETAWTTNPVNTIRFEKTEFGDIVFAGKQSSRIRSKNCAIYVDLGGDDMYLGQHAGAGPGQIRVVIDFAGNDVYQSTSVNSFGSGLLGIGALVDVAGNDLYASNQDLSFGAGFAGVGLLSDYSGSDIYRGVALSQGAAMLQGFGVFSDCLGDDRYLAKQFAQGFAGPGAIGICHDNSGDDLYMVNGGLNSSYETPGVFRAWSQGMSAGIRGIAAGGLGLLIDNQGDDQYHAGNFAQGCGYYFAVGGLIDGSGDDVYQGSRYCQGASAHYAGGIFVDSFGDDQYRCLVGAAHSAAWDVSWSSFLDCHGDDRYFGASNFRHGAAAHNSRAFFLDVRGGDEYKNVSALAQTQPNSYHGGRSVSLFADLGRAQNLFGSISLSEATQKNDRESPENKYHESVLRPDFLRLWSPRDLTGLSERDLRRTLDFLVKDDE